ncbi:hypothetical protein [Mycolicibacterium hippocampi]|nr:hypothetical protein [Mycolicibacterium hippocampi]
MSSNIDTMPETRAWSGHAHTAAAKMFGRAADAAGALAAYTTDVGAAFRDGAGTIGETRTALLNKADEIDMTGQLHVSDQWVVLITGAAMTAEEAAELERRAQAEQITVNGLLLAVGAADDATAAAVTAAAKPHGFQPPRLNDPGSMLTPGTQQPGDDVPDPSNPVGFLQQAMLRDTDMAQTIRDIKVESRYDPVTGEEMSTTTTYVMQDGSKRVRTANATSAFTDRSPAITEQHFDKDGNLIADTSSVTFNEFGHHSLTNSKVTTMKLADGTVTTLIERPDGRRTATVTTPDGRHADVPLNLLNHPIMGTASAGFSGLEAQAGHGIPMLTEEATEHIRVGAKYGGPAIGIATALWDVAVADSTFERCVAAAEGATSVASGTLAGVATAGSAPWLVVPAVLVASGGGQALGNWIGNTFCPR